MPTKKPKLIKPNWYGTLKFLAGIIEENDARDLVRIISENYFSRKPRSSSKLYAHYNPHIDDLYFSWECIQENDSLFVESYSFRLKDFFSQRKIPLGKIRKEVSKWQKVYRDHPQPFSDYSDYESYFKFINPEKFAHYIHDIISGIPNTFGTLAMAYHLKIGDTDVIKNLESLLRRTASKYNPHEDIHAVIRIVHSKNKPNTF